MGSTILHLLEGIPRSEHPALLGILLCSLPTDSMLELLSNLLSKVGNLVKQRFTHRFDQQFFQEHLGAIILKAMCEKSRRDLIFRFVNEDPVLKDRIINGEGSHMLDVKRNGELSEDDGFGSERVDSSEEKLVLSDSSEGRELDKEVMTPNLKDLATARSDYGAKEMKEEEEEETRWIAEDNLASRNADLDLNNSRPIDSNPGESELQENGSQDSYSSETKVSEKQEQQQASDTEICEEDEEEWEYEWEEGEDNEYEYMEHSEEEDDYTVESFAGSFSISVSK